MEVVCVGLCLALICVVFFKLVATRVVVLPDPFYLLEPSSGLMLPLYNEPEVELVERHTRRVELRLFRPMPARVIVRTRTGSYFICVLVCDTPFQLSDGVGIDSRALSEDTAGLPAPDDFGALTSPPISSLYLRITSRGGERKELATSWDVLCDLLGGPRIETWLPFDPSPAQDASIVAQHSGVMPSVVKSSPRVHVHLTRVSGRRGKLELTYMGSVRDHLGAGIEARDAMASVLTHYRGPGAALGRWSERPLHELALEALEDVRRAPLVRQLAARALLDLEEFARTGPEPRRARMERAVLTHWRDHDLDELLPRMRPGFLDVCETRELIEFAGVWRSARLRDALKARSSAVEVITDGRLRLEMRRDALVAAMHLRRAFLRSGEDILAGIEASEAGWVTEDFVQLGWTELWACSWLERRYTTWLEQLEAPAHVRLYEILEKSSSASGTPDAELLFSRIYMQWLEAGDRDLMARIPTIMLLRVLARRADFERDGWAWTHLFATIQAEQVMHLFDHVGLKEPQRLHLLARIVSTPRTRDFVDRDATLHLNLLGIFELASAASSSVSSAELDALARALLGHRHEGLDKDSDAKVLLYGVKAYVRQVERQGVRKGALETMHAIAEHLPSRYDRSVSPVIARWTEAMGSDTMSGALSYDDEDERHGALSMQRDEV